MRGPPTWPTTTPPSLLLSMLYAWHTTLCLYARMHGWERRQCRLHSHFVWMVCQAYAERIADLGVVKKEAITLRGELQAILLH